MTTGEQITIRIDAATEPLKRGLAEADRAIGASRQRIDAQMRRVDESFRRVDQAATRAGGGIRNALNGVSLQLQDVVVQLSAGTNPLQVLIQQGGQIAGAFGPAFGPAGLLIAGAGAAALAFTALTGNVDTLKAAAEAADRTAKALNGTMADGVDKADELAKKYRALTAELRDFERVAIARAQREIGSEQAALRSQADAEIRKLERRRAQFEQANRLRPPGAEPPPEQQALAATFAAIDKFRKDGDLTALTLDLDRLAGQAGAAAAPFRAIVDALVDPARRMQELDQQARRLDASLKILSGTATAADRGAFDRGGGGRGRSDAERQAERIRERIDALEFEAEQLRRTSRERAVYQALQQAGVDLSSQAGQRIAELAGRIYDETEARTRQAEATRAATAAAEAELRAREAAADRAQRLLEDRDAIGRSYREEVESNALLIQALRSGNAAYQEQAILLEILNRYRALGLPLAGAEIEQARELARTLAQQRQRLRENEVSARDFAFVLTSGLERAIEAGEGLRGTLGGILQDLAKIASRRFVMRPLEKAAETAFDWLGDTIGGWFDGLFESGGGNSALPGGGNSGLPGLASGGPATAGRPYIVGEQGPELFVPRTPGTVIPHDVTSRMLRGGGSGGDNIAISMPISIDARGAQEGVAQQIRRELALQAPAIVDAAVAKVGERRRRDPAYLPS